MFYDRSNTLGVLIAIAILNIFSIRRLIYAQIYAIRFHSHINESFTNMCHDMLDTIGNSSFYVLFLLHTLAIMTSYQSWCASLAFHIEMYVNVFKREGWGGGPDWVSYLISIVIDFYIFLVPYDKPIHLSIYFLMWQWSSIFSLLFRLFKYKIILLLLFLLYIFLHSRPHAYIIKQLLVPLIKVFILPQCHIRILYIIPSPINPVQPLWLIRSHR